MAFIWNVWKGWRQWRGNVEGELWIGSLKESAIDPLTRAVHQQMFPR